MATVTMKRFLINGVTAPGTATVHTTEEENWITQGWFRTVDTDANDLPGDFPNLTELNAANFTKIIQLYGLTAAEIATIDGIDSTEAATIVTAINDLANA